MWVRFHVYAVKGIYIHSIEETLNTKKAILIANTKLRHLPIGLLSREGMKIVQSNVCYHVGVMEFKLQKKEEVFPLFE